MKEETFVQVSLEDSKTKAISDVLGSKTCKKIIEYLAHNEEASQKDLSDALKIPMNTMDYNMKKLLDAGFIQKRKNFFWSKKGKKIIMYELSNKSIVISPKKSVGEKFKALVPGLMLTLAGTFAVYVYEKIKGVNPSYESLNSIVAQKAVEDGVFLASKGADLASEVPQAISSNPGPLWFAFMIGGLAILVLYAVLNWRKLE